MSKGTLRKKYLEARQQLSPAEFERLNDHLQAQLFEELSNKRGLVHIFLPIKDKREIDTWPILDWLWNHAWTICTSITHFDDNRLSHVLVTSDSDFSENKWGVPEPIKGEKVLPTEVDLVIIPMLCFDRYGHRVGYGKGYYDRFLSECRNDVIKMGVCLTEPIEEKIDSAEFDVAMDVCITPEQVYRY